MKRTATVPTAALPTGALPAVAVVAAVAVAVGLASACASAGLGGGDDAGDRFHRLWEDGRYPAAVAVFERDSTLHGEPRALWRVALARLRPAGEEEGAGPEDPAGAARALERLLELEPDGRRAVEARAMLRLLDTLEGVRTQLERLKEIDLGEEPGRR